MTSEQEMQAKLTACPECGGERVLAEALNSVQLVRPGTALPGITNPTTRLWAVVCLRCGHTTLYAKKPDVLAPKE